MALTTAIISDPERMMQAQHPLPRPASEIKKAALALAG
jgi:hypothetical protein